MSKKPIRKTGGSRDLGDNSEDPGSASWTDKEGFHLARMKITWDAMPDPAIDRMPPQARIQMSTAHRLMGEQPEKAVADLKVLTGKYPDVLCFRNWLYTCYRRLSDETRAWEECEAVFKDHPDYLFGRLAMVELMMEKDDLEGAEELLYRHGPSLPAIYPDQEMFHISEVLHWFYVCGRLMAFKCNFEGALSHLDVLKSLEPGAPAVAALERLLTPGNQQDLLMLKKFRHMIPKIIARQEQQKARAAARREAKSAGPTSPKQSKKP